MRKILILQILCFIFFSPTITYSQSLQFEINSKTTKHHADKTGEDAIIELQEKDEASTITLEPSKFSVESGDIEKIYDFTTTKLILVNHTNKTLTETSLYVIPAFKDFERKNRIGLAQIMQKTGIDALKADPFYLDALFGDDPDSKSAGTVSVATQNGETQYSYGGEEVTSYTLSDRSLPEDLRNIYKKYLIYEQSLHPMIWNELSQKDVLFSSLSYKIKQEVPALIEESVSAADFTDSNIEPIRAPKSYTKNYAINEELDHVIKLSMEQKEKTVDEYFKEMNDLLDQKNYLDASLVFHEYVIHIGGEDIDNHKNTIQRIFSEAPKGSGVTKLTNAIRQQPKSKEQLQKSIQIIEKARKKGTAHSYILNVFLANYLDMAGKTKEAKKLILEALENNPFLTGAYKDLGDKYFKSFDMMNAWASWDQMRRLNPNHMLAPHIHNFEQQIKQNHPVYFQ